MATTLSPFPAGAKLQIRKDSAHPQDPHFGGSEFNAEGWWSSVSGKSWKHSAAEGNPAAIIYQVRVRVCGLPDDENVVYGKIGSFGHLVHHSEIEVVEEVIL